jgi:MFS family permease
VGLALLCGAFFMVILDAPNVTVALPSIGEELGFSAQGLQWVVSAYALTFAGLLLLGGRAAEPARASPRLHGRPRLLYRRVKVLQERKVAWVQR